MKKILLLSIALIMLTNCRSSIITMTKVHEEFANYGQPYIEDEIQKDDKIIHYFFVNSGLQWRRWGWYCFEYISDKDGKILSQRAYYVGSPTNNIENEQSLDIFRKRIREGIIK